MKHAWLIVLLLVTLFPLSITAEESLVRFEGGIGVIPVSSAAGVQNADGTFPNVNRNDVRGVGPGGQPWVIARLSADVTLDGRIRVDGQGLLLAGGNGIGTNGNQSVLATLFCGSAAHHTNVAGVPLEPNGDFRIDDMLSPAPPDPCNSPVLLIRNVIVVGGVNQPGRWFAAGIQKLD